MSTIAAIATPPGSGGIGIARISGPGAKELLRKVFQPVSRNFRDFQAWKLHRGRLMDPDGRQLDDVLAVYMPGPATFTGEDVAEIHCHGSPFILRRILEILLARGCRLAERGEFSRRAFMNGRMDLSQAEAVAEMVASQSQEALRYSLNRLAGHLADKIRQFQTELEDLRALAFVAMDFPEDEVPPISVSEFMKRVENLTREIDALLKNSRRASLLQHGSLIVMAGPVNAGKSSLLNALSGRQRALVTDIPGTTRDFLEEQLDFHGLPARLVDTAGLRMQTGDMDKPEQIDMVEAMGIRRSHEMVNEADMLWLVLDGAQANPQPDAAINRILTDCGDKPLIVVWNKSDLGLPLPAWLEAYDVCQISALKGDNLESLVERSREKLLGATPEEDAALAPNLRQAQALETARQEFMMLLEDLREGQTLDACLTGLEAGSAALDELLGLNTHDEVLDRIFSQFCIGK